MELLCRFYCADSLDSTLHCIHHTHLKHLQEKLVCADKVSLSNSEISHMHCMYVQCTYTYTYYTPKKHIENYIELIENEVFGYSAGQSDYTQKLMYVLDDCSLDACIRHIFVGFEYIAGQSDY